MSEYLSKKAVLEWLKQEQRDEGWLDQIKHGFFWVEREIESGAFDADDSEVQRLRAALEKARQYVVNGYELGYIDDREGYTEALVREIDKALSATTEPTNAAKVERIECPCCGCEISINAPEGDGNDA